MAGPYQYGYTAAKAEAKAEARGTHVLDYLRYAAPNAKRARKQANKGARKGGAA